MSPIIVLLSIVLLAGADDDQCPQNEVDKTLIEDINRYTAVQEEFAQCMEGCLPSGENVRPSDPTLTFSASFESFWLRTCATKCNEELRKTKTSFPQKIKFSSYKTALCKSTNDVAGWADASYTLAMNGHTNRSTGVGFQQWVEAVRPRNLFHADLFEDYWGVNDEYIRLQQQISSKKQSVQTHEIVRLMRALENLILRFRLAKDVCKLSSTIYFAQQYDAAESQQDRNAHQLIFLDRCYGQLRLHVDDKTSLVSNLYLHLQYCQWHLGDILGSNEMKRQAASLAASYSMLENDDTTLKPYYVQKGSEWRSLLQMLHSRSLDKVVQLLVEFHHDSTSHGDSCEDKQAVIRGLAEAGFKKYHSAMWKAFDDNMGIKRQYFLNYYRRVSV